MISLFFGKRKIKEKSLRRDEEGFLLLYAILLMAVMLSVGMGILDISLKRISFSGIDKESIRAFYAADAGMECALYADLSLGGNFSTTSPAQTFDCNGDTITVGGAGDPPIFVFNFWLNKSISSNKSCAEVKLERILDVNGVITGTKVTSAGYNTECPLVGSAKRFPLVERGLKATY